MQTTAAPKSTTLYYRNGRSDKVYHAAIEPSGPGFAVTFAFGRHGSTLQTGTKTPAPVGYDEAEKIFDHLVRAKMAKGYTPGEDAAPYQQTPRQDRTTGVLPQLLNPIDEEQARRRLLDPAWWAQEKLDGCRVLIRRRMDEVVGINRQGLIIDLPKPIVDAALLIPSQQWLLDGEAIGPVFIAFDLLESACVNLREQPYSHRIRAMHTLLISDAGPSIREIATATTTKSKRRLWEQLKAQKREGIVLKQHAAPYAPGRPASGGTQLKCKFYATASCIVLEQNRRRRSVLLGLLDGGRQIAVGSVTIPANHQVPAAGTVVETRYLYAYRDGCLFQPVYLGPREGLPPEACRLDQLKYKPVADDREAQVG